MNKFILSVLFALSSVSLQGMEAEFTSSSSASPLTPPADLEFNKPPLPPVRPWKKSCFNRRNGAYVAAAVATAWATYAAHQVAKNIPQQEWENLSTIEKCKRIAVGTLPEMVSQAKRAVLFCVGR